MKVTGKKLDKFLDLVERVRSCTKCPRMTGSARVLGLACGSVDARLMFVGEAPGRLGADGSEIPFHGDKSGANFERLIEQVGISRYDAFVTNAVLCNPKDTDGNNSTPTRQEIANCSTFLKEQIELVNPQVVATLGAVALRACSMIDPHRLILSSDVRKRNSWFGRDVVPLYHPGQRAMLHRSFSNQLADYQFVAETVKGRASKKKNASRGQKSTIRKTSIVAKRILEHSESGISYFALHKLYYLSEIAHLEAVGERITNSYVIRQKDGPYCVDLLLSKLLMDLPEVRASTVRGKLLLSFNSQLSLDDSRSEKQLSETEASAIERTCRLHMRKTESELKTACYMTRAMRNLLKQERMLGMNMFNTAILPYAAKAVVDDGDERSLE